ILAEAKRITEMRLAAR
ncbi:hypothetical protein CARUB_v100232612mg, partial [Capsella rubella]